MKLLPGIRSDMKPGAREAVIIAGGSGTRLQPVLDGRPKALVDILGTPLLEHQLVELERFDFRRVTVLVRHEAYAIQRYCERRKAADLEIRIVEDRAPRGTAGAFFDALELFGDEVLAVYGDLLFNVQLERFLRFHAGEPEAVASLVLHPSDHPQDADIVELADDCAIRQIHRCPHPQNAWLPNMVNAAIYCLRPRLLPRWAKWAGEGSIDFAKDLFPRMLADRALLRGYITPEYVRDIGTPRRLQRARESLARGTPARSRLDLPQAAVFMDRDGTLVCDHGYIREPEDLHLLPGVSEALCLLEEAGYRRILVTNQPVVARGDCTEAQLRRIHNKLETLLGREGAFLDRIYYCPHHPDAGFPGEIPQLKVRCDCRKPRPGMLHRAEHDLNIDMRQSWMIGDSIADCAAAAGAGVTSVLLTHAALGDGVGSGRADFCFQNILEAVRFITTEYMVLAASVRPLVERKQARYFYVAGDEACARARTAAVLARELKLVHPSANILRLGNASAENHSLARDVSSLDRAISIYHGPAALELKWARDHAGPACIASFDRRRDGAPRIHIERCE